MSFYKQIIKNNYDFWINFKDSYLKDKKIWKMLDKIEESNLIVENIIKFDDLNYWFILKKLLYKFHAEHPKLYSKYYGWCSYHKINLPKDIYFKFLDSNTFKDIEKIFYQQI